METSTGDSTEKPKFEKVDSFAFKKFETFIILCVALAIGASEAAAMSADQVSEARQILEETRQNRQSDNAVTNGPMTHTTDAATHESSAADDSTKSGEETEEGGATAALESHPLDLPNNLRVPENMRPMLMRMLRSSATFRRQIAVLTAKPAVRVSVVYGGMRGDRNYHALSTVRKHEWGAMLVDTTVFVPTDLPEIIAHELEHVCEQMEGVDLPSLSRRKGVGVYNLNGHYETVRAIRAGQNATREYQDGADSLQHTVNAPF
jgi:hypothetical protein